MAAGDKISIATKASVDALRTVVQDAVDGSIQAVLDSELVATDIANKLIAKEQEYAPRLTGVESGLASIATEVDTIVTGLDNYYVKCLNTDTGALLVVASGAIAGQINLSAVSPRMSTYTPVVGDYVTKASNILNAELILARNSAIKSKVFGSVDARLEEAEAEILVNTTNITNKVDLAIVDTKTGVSIQSAVSDDLIGGVELTKIEGATLIAKPNESADISPDNVAVITFSSNFDLVACAKNILSGMRSGTYNPTTGAYESNASLICSQNMMPIGNYVAVTVSVSKVGAGTNNMIVACYGSNKNYLGRVISTTGWYALKKHTFNLLQGTVYINLYVTIDTVPLSALVQVELGFTATIYEQYKSNKISIPYELAKLPSGLADTIELGVDGKWKKIQRIGKRILNSSEAWGNQVSVLTNTSLFECAASFGVKASGSNNVDLVCDKFLPLSSYAIDTQSIYTNPSGLFRIRINKSLAADPTAFKSWLATNPVTVYYELATPIETIISDQTIASYKGVTNIYTTANPPVTVTSRFKSRLRNVYELLAAAIIRMGGTI
jgi:hypothetical protein